MKENYYRASGFARFGGLTVDLDGASVEAELAQKDNDTYRRQNAVIS